MRIPILDDALAPYRPGRLMLVFLATLLMAALVLSLLGMIAPSPLALVLHTGFLLAVCWLGNLAFARAFDAGSNSESVLISALILALILSPAKALSWSGLELPLFAGLWAMASKYLFRFQRQPIFNPAAFGAFCASALVNSPASWWVGNTWSLGFVLAGGLFVLRKIRGLDLALSFGGTVLAVCALLAPPGFARLFVSEIVTRSALLFFAVVMLTEPRTMPIGRPWRIAFGVLVGLLFAPATHFGALRFSPESALLIGNIFSAAIKWRRRRMVAAQRSV